MNNATHQEAKTAYLTGRGISPETQALLGIKHLNYSQATDPNTYNFGKSATSPHGIIYFPFDGSGTEGIAKNWYPDQQAEIDHLAAINAAREAKEEKPQKRVAKYLQQLGSTGRELYFPCKIFHPDQEINAGDLVVTEDVIGSIKAAARGIPIASFMGVWLASRADLAAFRDGISDHPLKGLVGKFVSDSDTFKNSSVMGAQVRNGFEVGCEVGCFPAHLDRPKIGLDEWLDINPEATKEDFEKLVKAQCADVLTWLEMTIPGLLETLKDDFGYSTTQASVIGSKVREAAIHELLRHQSIEDLRANGFYNRVLKPLGQTLDVLESKERSVRAAMGEGDSRESMADLVVKLVKSEADLFHDSEQNAYADVIVDDCRHTYPLQSTEFKRWVSRRIYETSERVPNNDAYQAARGTLESIAIFDGREERVWLRVAEFEGRRYLDLANDKWQAVEIDSTGWRIVDRPSVRFIRPSTMLPLPTPINGGNLDDLKELLSLSNDDWVLLITFLLFCFTTGPTFPVLLLAASRGSGKSTIAEFLKNLIDPGKAGLVNLTSDEHRASVAASRRWMLAYDNISSISPAESDLLCRFATGFGFSTRTLFTTTDETVFELARPQILTAIDHVVTRDDLSDRLLMVQLPPIEKDKRLRKRALDEKLEALRPHLLGALLTALSQTLAALPDTPETDLPRMADFGHFALAAEKPLGFEAGTFRGVFDKNREAARQVVLESSPLAEAIQKMLDQGDFSGTATKLLERLKAFADKSITDSKYWPKATNALTRQLNRLKPDLLAVGIFITESKASGDDRSKTFEIKKVATKI